MSVAASNDVWLDKMPSDWQRSRIRNVAVLSPNFSATNPAPGESCSIVPMELLSVDGAIDATNQQPLEEISSGLPLFEKGDVLFAKITPCMENGKGAFVRKLPTRYAFGSTEFHVLRPSKKIDGAFLYYATFNPIYRAYAAENMVGAAGQKRVSSRFVKDTRLFLPPLPEQQRIAAYLDASCAAIDAALSAKGRQLETLDAFRKAIILRTVTQGLNPNVAMRQTGVDWAPEIPVHWEVSKLNTLFWFRKGDRAMDLTQKYIAEYPGEFPVYSGQTADEGLMGSVDSFEFDFASPVIFVTTVGAKAMTTRIVSGKFSLSQNCALIIPWHRGVNVDYYEPAIQSLFDFERRSIALIMQPSLRFKDLKKFRLPVPPRDEQCEIVAFLKQKSESISEVARSIEKQITTLTAYRKSLIHECVTGQRRITEVDLNHVKAHG